MSALENYCENEAKDYCGFTLPERKRVDLGNSSVFRCCSVAKRNEQYTINGLYK